MPWEDSKIQQRLRITYNEYASARGVYAEGPANKAGMICACAYTAREQYEVQYGTKYPVLHQLFIDSTQPSDQVEVGEITITGRLVPQGSDAGHEPALQDVPRPKTKLARALSEAIKE